MILCHCSQGYLAKHGIVDLSRVQMVLQGMLSQSSDTFRAIVHKNKWEW